MDLNLEIEQGSQSDNIGKNLGQSAANLGKGMVMSAGTGAANVVASTGINIGNGSKDQIIADNISAAINLTGEQGLTNLASGLENYSQQLAAMGLNAPEQLVNILLGTVTDVLSENGVINQVQKGLQITTNTVDLAKKGLNIACSAATAIANVKKLLTKLNKMQDVDATCIPSVKDSVSALSASLIQQLTAQYEALKQQLIVFYNSMICTSNDAVLDNIIVSINNILEVVEPALDPILQQNTGYTISEVRNICNQGFAYIGMIERAAAAKRIEDQAAKDAAENQTIEDEEKTDNEGTNAAKLGNDLKEQGEEAKDTFKKIGSTVSDDTKKMSEETKEKFKKEKIEKSKEKWKEKTKDLSKDAAKEKLMAWLKEQPIILQNAFHILVIKDTIDRIKTFLSQLQNTSIENQADLLNMLTDVLGIFEMLGINPGAVGITLDDLKALGMGVAGTLVDTAVNIGQQVQDNATAATQQMAAQAGVGDVVGGARNAVANISDLSNLTNKLNETGGNINNATQGVKDKINGTLDSAKSVGNSSSNQDGEVTSSSLNSNMASDEDSGGVSVSGKSFATNIVKATGSDIVAGMVDSGINSVIDAASNMDMDAVANGGGQEMLQSTLDNINPNRSKAIPPFTYTQSNQDKNIYIDITINKRPSLHLIKIMSFIKSFKSGKDQIFNNGATKQIKDAFYEAWESDDPFELLVNAKVGGITKFYNFTFTVNKSERNNPDNEVEETESEQLLSGATSGISGEAQNLMNNTSRITNNAGQQITSLAGNAAAQSSNLVNSGIDAASNMADSGMNSVSQLSKVDIVVDMSAIESVLQGKVLIFDPIIKILQALLPVVEIIKVVCKLLQNYMINKEFVRTKQHVDLGNALRDAAQFVMGLKDIIELKDTNFFTVRTQKMANWATDTFKKSPDENGTITIDIIGTTKLNTYCAINLIRPECPLDLRKGTTLYYDKWGIENGGYNDGTTRGLDNIEINRDLGEVYYDSKQRSTIASEILRARKRKVDPKKVKTREIVAEPGSVADSLNLTEAGSVGNSLNLTQSNSKSASLNLSESDSVTGSLNLTKDNSVGNSLNLTEADSVGNSLNLTEDNSVGNSLNLSQSNSKSASLNLTESDSVTGSLNLTEANSVSGSLNLTEAGSNGNLLNLSEASSVGGSLNLIESGSIGDLLNLTEFTSDEIEGQQTLNLCNLNLCNMDLGNLNLWQIPTNPKIAPEDQPNLENAPEDQPNLENVPESPNAPQSPGSPNAPQSPGSPNAPQSPGSPNAPGSPGFPNVPGSPNTPEFPNVPESPEKTPEGQPKSENATEPQLKPEKTPQTKLNQEKISEQRAVIIEFGDEYTLGDRVDYNIIVKPGQTINEGDILGYITKGNTQQPIRTKFTGVVRGINDYSHLYPSAARNHFIIDNYSPCMPVDYNVNDVMNLSNRFKKSSELGAFILNCMPLSILPILLVNANRDNNTNNSIITGGIQETTGVFSKFEEIMSDYDTSINAFNNDIVSISQPDNFNSSNSSDQVTDSNGKSYYKVPIDRNEKIKNSIMELREKMIGTAISVYNKALYEKPIGSYSYEDCIGLAFDDNLSLTYGIYKENSKDLDKDKKIVNTNYYINLLQNIPESKNMSMPPINIDISSINSKLNKMYGTEGSSDAVDVSNDKTVKGILNSLSQVSNNTEENEDNYINEYRDIIESIISNRLSLEQKTTDQIYTYFNQYYSKNILGSIKTVDAFTQLKNKLVDQEYSLNDNTAILNLIKLDKLGKTYDLKDSKDFNKFQKADSKKMKKDEKYYNQCQYALTMFVYLLHADVEKTIKPLNKILIEPSENYNNKAINASSKKSSINQKRKNNQKYFELIQKESKLIIEFWKKVLAAYNGKYNLDNVINDMKGYADKMNSYAKWPIPININVDNINYELYTFADKYEEPKSAPEEIMVPVDMGNVEIPDPVIDLDNLPEPRDRDKITIMDYPYWLVYMLNATLFTLIPLYWADGFDIPPFMVPLPLPGIYFPIAPPVMIPIVNVLMVFGIAFRGFWPAPIILIVNLSSNDIDAMIFIKIALEIAKDIFRKSQELIENGIPKMVNKIAEGYISENQMAQKTIEKFKTYSSIIRAIPIEDKALIEKKFNEALVDEMNKQTKLNETNNKLEKTKNKLKNFDRRQIITRESDLGNGPEPM